MKAFLQTITQIGSFMICAQLMIHFRPDGSYEKYLKFLVSMMVLAQLLTLAPEWLKNGKSPEEISVPTAFDWKLTETESAEMEQNAERILEEITLLQWRTQQEETQQEETQQEDLQVPEEQRTAEHEGNEESDVKIGEIGSIVIEPIGAGGTNRKGTTE